MDSDPNIQLIPRRESSDSEEGDSIERTRASLRKSREPAILPPGWEDQDLLFFRSLLPYMSGLPLVSRLSLRSEITTAVMRAWEKKNHQLSSPIDDESDANTAHKTHVPKKEHND